MKVTARVMGGAALVAIVVLGLASAQAGARGEANTKVTIQGGGGLVEGEVKSPNENKCADGRKVVVFKVKNGEADRVGSDTATENGGRYQWGLDVGNGKFFAKAPAIQGCKGDTSKTVKGQ